MKKIAKRCIDIVSKYASKALAITLVFSLSFGWNIALVQAAQNYNVTISTPVSISGLTLNISGTMFGEYVGQQSDQFVRVTNWGDASATTDATTNFVFGTGKSFTGTWSASHAYTSGGTYSVTVEICHQSCSGAEGGDTAIDTEVIVIPDPNDAPTLSDVPESATIPELSLYTFDASATDPNEGDVLVFSLVGAPTGATIDSSTGVFSWTPSEAQGPEGYEFEVMVSDGEFTDSQLISISVDEVNQAPTTSGASVSLAMNGSEDVVLSANDADLPAQSLTYSIVGEPSNGSVVINGDTATYVPNADFTGTDSFTFKVTDDYSAESNVSTINITISNDAPNLTPIGDQTISEGSTLNLNPSATDPNEDPLSYSLEGTVANVTFNTETGAFTFSPDESQGFGTYTFTITVTDGNASDSTTFTITVSEVNIAPVANDDTVNTNEDTAVDVTVSGTDADLPTQTLTYSIGTNPANGTVVVLDADTFTYTPSSNFHGSDSFTFKVSDGELEDEGTITINIVSVNDAPSIELNGSSEVAIQEGGTYEEQGAVCTDQEDENFQASVSGTVNTSEAGDYTITYTCTDSDGASTQTTRTVTIQEAPALCNDGKDNDQDGKTDFGGENGDPGCSSADDNDETDPVVTPPSGGNPPSGGGGGASGPVFIPSSPTPQVLGASTTNEGRVLGATTCSAYLGSYIKYGAKNNADDVKKLQEFLNEYMNLSLAVDGRYGPKTMKALKEFQVKYADEVLVPWQKIGVKNNSKGTGYVYKTTKRWINMLKCPELNLEMPILP